MIRAYRPDDDEKDLSISFSCDRCGATVDDKNALAGFDENGKIFICCQKDEKGQPCQRIITKQEKIQKWFPVLILYRELIRNMIFDLSMSIDYEIEDIYRLQDI